MTARTPKATSVTPDGEPDDFEIPTCWYGERNPAGGTRLVVSAPPEGLERAHRALIAAMSPTVQVLYRQIIDRRDPQPQGSPARDFVGLGLDQERALAAFRDLGTLLYSDARGELWVRDDAGSQLVLDCDGLIFAYPDDPAFRDALVAAGFEEGQTQTVAERDYVRHNFLVAADLDEDALIQRLNLSEVAPQARSGSRY